MSFHPTGLQWNEGELDMQNMLRVPQDYNPTSMFLNSFASNLLARSPLVAVGALDAEAWPWTSLWGGEPGFSQSFKSGVIGVKATVDRMHDPVLQALLGESKDGEPVQWGEDDGKMVSAVAIDLHARKRVKLYGKSVVGVVSATQDDIGELQLAVKIEQSLANCPKYLNKKQIIPRVPQPRLEATSFPLPQPAIDLLSRADLFFISSSNHTSDMDTNHRGGPKGFVRILENNADGFTLVYPEYSGNRLYQTLGNLRTTPRAGLVFPDFETGDVLYLTGTTQILAGKDAAELIGRTNLAVKIKVKAYKFVRSGLAFRAEEEEFSPYNPAVRYLTSEDRLKVGEASSVVKATLVTKEILTPTIGRFRFKIDTGEPRHSWKAGQWVALDFSDELDLGYSHMREDDPKSLNDDWIRTFTVSSRRGLPADDDDGILEITIRKVGPVTSHLFTVNPRTQLEIGVKGFGGDFFFKQPEGESISFIAAGVGITPLLAQVDDLDLARLKLYWTVKLEDLPLIFDTLTKYPGLKECLHLYVTGNVDGESADWQKANALAAQVQKRRFTKEDFKDDVAKTFYLCTGTPLRNALLEWLGGKTVVYENFDY